MEDEEESKDSPSKKGEDVFARLTANRPSTLNRDRKHFFGQRKSSDGMRQGSPNKDDYVEFDEEEENQE